MNPRRLAHATVGWIRHPRPPRRTVRLRLTLLYGGLFLACGSALSVATYLLVAHALPSDTVHRAAQPHSPIVQHPAPRVSKQQLIEQQRNSDLHQLVIGLSIALAIATVLAVALGWLLARRLLRPLRSMTAATQRISDHNLHQRLAVSGPDDELKQLADTIDDLLGRLEGAFDAQRRFVANASHELRTPLTMMRTAVDVATNKPQSRTPGVALLAGKVRLGLDRADRLVESFLILARAQHAGVPHANGVALDQVAVDVLAEHSTAISDMRLTIDQDVHAAPVRGSEALLTHLLDNLIDNAIRHNYPGGWIHVVTSTETGTARLIVENTGPVLDQDQVADLVQPFRRHAPDRTSVTDTGVGLGLAIVAAIVETHHGSLDLHAPRNGGLRVTVALPHARQPALTAEAPA